MRLKPVTWWLNSKALIADSLLKIKSMAKNRKYDYRIVQDGASWRAEIVRQVTAKTVRVSKSQAGFMTATDAQGWAEKALQTFAETLSESNKRHAEKRQHKTRLAEEKQQAQAALKAAQELQQDEAAAESPKTTADIQAPDKD